MIPFQPSEPVSVALPDAGMACSLGARLDQAQPPHSTPNPNSHFCPPWPTHPVIGVVVRERGKWADSWGSLLPPQV